MVLRNLANEETFILENLLKLGKNSEILCHPPPLPPPNPQLSETETPLDWRGK